MKCLQCGHEDPYPQITYFLGWPVSMWFDIQRFLKENGAPESSPLAILSRLTANQGWPK